jgi:quinol monooxygenase YgiN
MITVLARMRVDDWNHFKSVHDQAERQQLRVRRGNLTHQVLNQLDDATDVVFLDTWSSPQDSDSYYHSDDFQRDLEEMGASLAELIKLEETDAASIDDGAALR